MSLWLLPRVTEQYLSIELLKLMTGISLIYVPYKGGGPALTDLLGAQVQSIVTALQTVISFLSSGRVRALGVTCATRSPQALDEPDTRQRLTEQGVDALPMAPERFAAYIRAETAKWAKVAKAAGIVLE